MRGAITDRFSGEASIYGDDTVRIKSVVYADDGLYYGNIGDTPMLTPNSAMVTSNIQFNIEKSGWVKKDGM